MMSNSSGKIVRTVLPSSSLQEHNVPEEDVNSLDRMESVDIPPGKFPHTQKLNRSLPLSTLNETDVLGHPT